MALSFLEQFEEAVRTYPAANVTLELLEKVQVLPPPGTTPPPPSVNVNDIWKLRFRIRNNGLLNMTAVSLRVTGENGAQVNQSSSAGPWTTTIAAFGSITLNAHGGSQDVATFMKAPPGIKPANTELVCVQISAFDANLNHILIDHSGSSTTPKICYKDQVFPT